MEPVSNVDRFTRILMIFIGIIFIVIVKAVNTLNAVYYGYEKTTTVINGFKTNKEENECDTEDY